MTYRDLVNRGAKVLEEVDPVLERFKAYGAMWSGSAKLKLGDVTYHFLLWSHLDKVEGVTREEAEEHLSLKGIEVRGLPARESLSRYQDSNYYDVFWYTYITPEEIWLHPQGWFHDKELERKLFGDWSKGMKGVLGTRSNYNWQRNEKVPDEVLTNLGFVKIL